MGAAMAGNGATFSVIGADVVIRGDIEASADLHVDGVVLGNLSCANLVQGETSRIEGAIVAERVRLSGHVVGAISTRDLVLLKSARVQGDVSYETLTIEQGAEVDGRFAPRGAASGKQAGKQAAKQTRPASDELTLTLASAVND
jgi:cytoskeletal protein CcmA (bactofilin family)